MVFLQTFYSFLTNHFYFLSPLVCVNSRRTRRNSEGNKKISSAAEGFEGDSIYPHHMYCTFLSHWRAHDRINTLTVTEDYGFGYAFRWKTEDV